MRTNLNIYIPIIVALLLGCKDNPKQQQHEQPKAKLDLVQEMISPAGASSALPHLVSNKDVTLLSWVETEGDSLTTLKYSELVDGSWQKTQTVMQGTDWFVNWADYPMIAENNGNLWSHTLKKSTADTYSYDVKMNVKPKGAAEWTTDLTLHTDETPTEHGFVSVIPFNDNFFVNWLDGRNTMENEEGTRGAMTLRAGVISTSGQLLQEDELDVSTCDCCQTSSAITDAGPVVVYRDRTENEIRDIAIVRQVNGKWTTPKIIFADNWNIKGCPVNGPKAAALGNNLVVAWFTAAQDNPRVQIIFSKDGGEEFQKPILIAEGNAIGRVDVLWMDEENAVVSWVESSDASVVFTAMKVSVSGVVSKKHIIVALDGSRQSGFPQMEIADETLFFAWTSIEDETSSVKTGFIPLEQF